MSNMVSNVVSRYWRYFVGYVFTFMAYMGIMYALLLHSQVQVDSGAMVELGLRQQFFDLLIYIMAFHGVLSLVVVIVLVVLENNIVGVLNRHIGFALSERKLEDAFDNLCTNRSLFKSLSSVQKLLKLFRSFDLMKSGRVACETESIKMIMNDIEEGVVIIDKDLFVKSINHNAEKILGLIPGEIINHMFSRKVNDEALLSELNQAVSDSQRINGFLLVHKKQSVLVDIIPVLSSNEETVRLIMILKPVDETDSSEG